MTKKILSRKTMIPAAAFFAGALFGILGLTGVKYFMHHNQSSSLKQAWQRAQDLDDSLFQRINKRMKARMEQQQTTLDSLVKQSMDMLAQGENDSLDKVEKDFAMDPFKDGGERENIAVETTGSNIVYRVPIEDIADKKVKVDVQDGMVTVTAKTEQSGVNAKGDSSSTAEIISQFQKTFPLVAGANPAKMDFTIQKDLIVIRFPKLKGA